MCFAVVISESVGGFGYVLILLIILLLVGYCRQEIKNPREFWIRLVGINGMVVGVFSLVGPV